LRPRTTRSARSRGGGPRRAGLERFVYHRPGHGLYDPAGGYGYNHSNNLLITKDRGVQMNKTSLTKESSWLAI